MTLAGSALIGYSGFVGRSVCAQAPFDERYNSANIDSIRDRQFSLLVCAAPHGVKRRANSNPDEDWASISRLMEALAGVRTAKAVLLSTVDVYPSPAGVDETSPIDHERVTPYGRHRRLLELFFLDRFPTLVVRLPGIFGDGLQKNMIYDLLHEDYRFIHPDGVVQYYDLRHLWTDVQTALGGGLSLLNIATEPLATREIAAHVFDVRLNGPAEGTAPRYDMQTRFGAVFGRRDAYLYDKDEVLTDLRSFVERERLVTNGRAQDDRSR